jgi:hypothetical protein
MKRLDCGPFGSQIPTRQAGSPTGSSGFKDRRQPQLPAALRLIGEASLSTPRRSPERRCQEAKARCRFCGHSAHLNIGGIGPGGSIAPAAHARRASMHEPDIGKPRSMARPSTTGLRDNYLLLRWEIG